MRVLPIGRRALARIAVNLAPRRSPYGGGNQFVAQLKRSLGDLGFDVVHRLDGRVDLVVVVEARDEAASFSLADIQRWLQRRTDAIVIHRVNECDRRKGTSTMDDRLAQVNALAHHTVFVSSWLREHHAERWFDRRRPNSVILAGADPRVFHPLGGARPSALFRVATHHWSDNPMKGFAVYEQIDRAIADGRLPGFELLVVGRWPSQIRWSTARLKEPVTGRALAEVLRSANGYVTASLWEPGPMHVAEALQSGLPVAYHRDGGGIAELVGPAGIAFGDDVVEALLRLRERHAELRQAALQHPHSGDLMCLQYAGIVQRLLAARIGR